jgi:hypothetical protein
MNETDAEHDTGREVRPFVDTDGRPLHDREYHMIGRAADRGAGEPSLGCAAECEVTEDPEA